MSNRIEHPQDFKRRMVNWPTDQICEEIDSNTQDIFFSMLDFYECEDPSSPKAQKILDWIIELAEDNKMMMEELNLRLEAEFLPYLTDTLIDIFGKGGKNAT